MKSNLCRRSSRPVLLSLFVSVLAACGGGGGGGGSTSSPSPAPTPPAPAPAQKAADSRDGTYVMVAANGVEYQLELGFASSSGSYRITGNGLDLHGGFQASTTANEFTFGPPFAGVSFPSMNFTLTSDNSAVVGVYSLAGQGSVPFIATRSIATALPTTTLTFTMLGRTVDPATNTANTTIQQGRITADGHLQTCDDNLIYEIASCPAGSTTTSTLTIANGVISAPVTGGTALYRLATIGGEPVLLRASPSSNNTRRFIVGLPVATSFNAGTFNGGTSEPAWGSVTMTTTSFSTIDMDDSLRIDTRSGSATPVGAGNTLASLVAINAGTDGSFFGTASSQLGAVVAARGSSAAPGFVALGVRR